MSASTGATLTQPSHAAAQWAPVRARAVGAEALQQKRFDFGRKAVLEALGGVVHARPVQSDHVGEQFLGKLMTQRQTLGLAASLAGQANVAVALDAQ